jgi:hypothetical protein
MGDVIDLALHLEQRRRARACESCAQRPAAARVFRSDAIAAGLGARRQCLRCLAAELRRGRCGPDAQQAVNLLAQRLRGSASDAPLALEWDVRAERAVALDGVNLP